MNPVTLPRSPRKSLGLRIIPVLLRGHALLFVCALFLSPVPKWAYSQSYTFATLAGVPGGTGTNDGVNQSAQFSFPTAVASDQSGNLILVADYSNSTIRQGIPAAVPVPELQILMSSGQVVLTWPACVGK